MKFYLSILWATLQLCSFISCKGAVTHENPTQSDIVRDTTLL